LDGLPTRLTIPLGTVSSLSGLEPKSLCPRLTFDGVQLCALPHLSAAFRVKDLGRAMGSLSAHSDKLVGAIDAVLSGV
jgi:toxin CcdB